MNKCKVIAIANQKGGVGKTTTVMNLGVGLVKSGKRVLLVDVDPQGSLSISLGIKNPDELDITLSSILQDEIAEIDHPPDFGIIEQAEGVDLIPANIDLSAFEVGLINSMSREYVMKNYLERIKHNYDFILIDCMPSLGVMTINALACSDSVIIPSQPNFLSTKGINQLVRSIARVRKQINPDLQIEGVLFTMVDSRTNNAKDIISSLRSTGSSLRVFNAEIPKSVKAAECSLEGKSVFSHDKDGKVAKAYEALTKEVLGLIIETICGLGIRVSELSLITLEAVEHGEAVITCKGKTRKILLVSKLKKKLLRYAKKQKITAGSIFVTRNGKPLDQSNIWREMKKLSLETKVSKEKLLFEISLIIYALCKALQYS